MKRTMCEKEIFTLRMEAGIRRERAYCERMTSRERERGRFWFGILLCIIGLFLVVA